MGILATGSAHAGPSARPPINTGGIFFINFLAKSENSKHFSFFSQKKLKTFGWAVKLSKCFSDQVSR